MGPALPGMRCVKFLGAGGFADVYLYERDQPRIKVAVKIMKTGSLTDAQRRQFEAEADTMALLAEHPFIVPVLGAGTSAEGRPYLVMTYYPSADLAARVSQTPMSVAEALRYGIQLASAVETAHRSGIIHRDIKPSNILLSSYGVMGLSDFGIAGRPTDMTEEDEVGISLPWSPREVVVGDSNGSVHSDVYSLAATVWHLMMGRAPFYIPGGDNTERATVTRILHEKPSPLHRPDAPPSLDRLLQQAMSKDPAHRPQSALELAQHLQRIEQELRLARTEIVVLDHGAQITSAIPVGEVSEATNLWDRSGPGPTGPGITKSGITGRVADPAATELKPPTRVVAQAPSAMDRPTDLRPARVTAESPAPIEASPNEPQGRWKLIAAAVVLLLAAVGGGYALTAGEGGAKSAGTVTQPPVDGSLGGGGGGAVVLTAVEVLRPSRTGALVTFRWAAVPGVKTYYVSTDGSPAKKPVTGTSLPVTSATRVCLTVVYVKGGRYSPPQAEPVCG